MPVNLTSTPSYLATLGSSATSSGVPATQTGGQAFGSLSESAFWSQFLTTLIPILQQLLAQIQQLGQPQPEPQPQPQPQELELSASEGRIFGAQYLTDDRGNGVAGRSLTVLDGENGDGRLNSGDSLQIKDANGNTVSAKVLTQSDVYALRFRENMVKYAERMGDGGWDFSENNVDLATRALNPPQTRNYADENGSSGTETVLKRNAYWEIVERDGQRLMLQRRTDDQGNRIQASDALRDVFNNPQNYQFDCATPMRLLNLVSTLDTIGASDFNRQAGRLKINSWYDQHDNTTFDGGFSLSVRTVPAGTISVGGRANIAGEFAVFDPAKGDKLVPGDTYYFDRPGDTSTSAQGWNAVYLGKNADGSYRFWLSELGVQNVAFQNGTWIPVTAFSGFYLGASVASPNTTRLASWDADRSVMA